MRLETKRLILRSVEKGDADAYFALYSDAEAMKYWSEIPWTNRSQADERVRYLIDTASSEDISLVMELKGTGEVIGTCSLFNFMLQCRRAEIGYMVGRAYWRQGYGSEALSALLNYGIYERHLNRVEADIDPRNRASERLLTKLGFKREGLLRERWIVGGVISDTGYYGLLASDWQYRF